MKHARPDYARIQDPAGLIPEDEPVFLLRGQDKFAANALRAYALIAETGGASKDIWESVREQAELMDAWPVKKMPDAPIEKT